MEKDNIEDLKKDLLEDIAEVIKEETTDDVELLEEIDKSTVEIAKESLQKKDSKHLLIKTIALILIGVYETFAIMNANFDVVLIDALICGAAWYYLIIRIRSKTQTTRLFLEIPILIPFFLFINQIDGGIDFMRWLILITIIVDYVIDFLVDLMLHKQFLMISIMWIAILFLGTIGYVRFEDLSLGDSFWLVWVTSTTVGYGDFFAVTTYGRLVTIFLMLGGIAIVSSLTAFILDFINKRSNEKARQILDNEK